MTSKEQLQKQVIKLFADRGIKVSPVVISNRQKITQRTGLVVKG